METTKSTKTPAEPLSFIDALDKAQLRYRAHPSFKKLEGTPWENDAAVIAADMMCDAVKDERSKLLARIAELEAEGVEQARLLGAGGSREAALKARIAELEGRGVEPWPKHICEDMQKFVRMYPEATPDMIARHARAMDELTPDPAFQLRQLQHKTEVYDQLETYGCTSAKHWLDTTSQLRAFREAAQVAVDALVDGFHSPVCAYRMEIAGGYDDTEYPACNCGRDAALAELAEIGVTLTKP